jgi:hypothetical protein
MGDRRHTNPSRARVANAPATLVAIPPARTVISPTILAHVGPDVDRFVGLRDSLDGPPGNRPLGGTGALEGHWRADGRQIYFIAGDTMMAQNVEAAGSTPTLGTATPLFRVRPNTFGRNAFVVTPDGKRFLVRTGP